MNKKYITETLVELLNTPSPSGYCKDVMNKLAARVSSLGYQMTFTKKGNGHIEIEGVDKTKTIGVAAHVDTLGAMVRSINSSGTLNFTTVGGYTMHSVEGEYVVVHTRGGKTYTGTILNTSPSVHVYDDARTQERKIDNMEIRLDEVVASKEDVEKLGISTGDFVSLDARAVVTGSGYIKSRHLDDKAGVASIIGWLEELSSTKAQPRCNIKILISTYEEVGHGSSAIPWDLDEFIAIDMGAMGKDLACTEQQVSICAKDSSGPYDYEVVSGLIDAAKKAKINHAVDIYPFYGSDVSAARSAGHEFKGGLIGPGVHASHHMERTHIDGIVETAKLLKAYL
ncbi:MULTISPECIES: M42 family metallopeptidase [unclassified Fusibacter]|uniref:M42 family metallopeptidase n=1 Tax=unclassified Fusibacter TaxID=2624464 RepID=UPI001013A5AA|nr:MULTISPECIES: M42 family metallopeptidase [unclassified Fusibacter]MCK8060780.1 M42 family metallopeptidase [Fusibacter sp. A2]NPE23076.1 M42 family metallopeptidase [Fusibacter sp. A1]RXV59746.1 M20/M25/M40 family metallo-hydrolase [Fusibacter sp. A1]